MASRRPTWRTPAQKSGQPQNAHYLDGVRQKTYFGNFENGQRQCVAVARGTKERCRCVCVQGSDYCRTHGGKKYMAERIQKLGGPTVRKFSVPVGMTKRALECETAIALEGYTDKLSRSVRSELRTKCLSERGRKLAKAVAELEARGALSD